MRVLLFFVLLGAAHAQQFEIGALGGGGFLNGVPIQGGPAPVSAGFSPGPAAGIVFSHDRYARWSGEIRYLFEERDPQLTSGGASASFSGQAHAMQYDMVFHTRPRKERIQPYLAVGGGIKVFRGTGAETAYRPLMQYGYLTQTSEWKPMLALGGGLKIRVSTRLMARVDFQNQVTRFPQKVITPAPGMTLGGWLLDFIPTVGLSWIF
ncbi:conserved exported hypothetical protein [Candidatus Sulfopaludibacter sp. SbA4]|nr:conserved exported hypothetical protein [Candidatus Sulfopaludibacter sp. SbA4]